MLLNRRQLVIDFMNARKVVDNLVAQEEKEIDGVHFETHVKLMTESSYKPLR